MRAAASLSALEVLAADAAAAQRAVELGGAVRRRMIGSPASAEKASEQSNSRHERMIGPRRECSENSRPVRARR